MALTASLKAPTPAGSEEGVLLHDGKKYAVGLTWLTADDEIDIKLAKDRAKKMEADFYTLRSSVAIQQGFGFLPLGHKTGLPSAASLASDMLVGEWHGVFAADNGWWYIAVHADAIAPDGDQFFFSEEQAYQHFQHRAENYKWPRSYVPENWNIPDANTTITLDKLLDDTDRASFLKPTNLNALFGGARQKTMAMMVVGAFIAFLLVAFVAPSLFSADRPNLNEMVRNRVFVPSQVFAPPPVPRKDSDIALDLSDLQAAPPVTVVDICANAFAKIALPVPGWDMMGLVCNASNQQSPNVLATWQKKSGSLDMAKEALNDFPEGVTISFNGTNQISARAPAGDLRKIIAPLEMGKREPILEGLHDRFGSLGRLEVKDITPPAPRPQRGVKGLVAQEQAPAPPPYMTLKLTTDTPPNILSGYFDVAGLKVQTVQWNKRTGSWLYEAEIQYDSKALREYYAYKQRQKEKQ